MEYKTILIRVPSYSSEVGLKLDWEKNFYIKVKKEDGAVILQANENGLISLARHLLALADSKVPENVHVHFDESNSLEEGSVELIIEKT